MKQLQLSVANFLKHEDGPTAVEYAVMLALIIAVCIGVVQALGSNASNAFNAAAAAAGDPNSNLYYDPATGQTYNSTTGYTTNPDGSSYYAGPGLGAEALKEGGVRE